MKYTLLSGLMLLSTLLTADTSIFEHKTQQKPKGTDDAALCKLFTDKAIAYEKTMRDDDYAKVTLQSYKHRAALYCHNENTP